MSNLSRIYAAGQDALELQVEDVEAAIGYYGAELGSIISDHIGRAAYVVLEDALVILRESPKVLSGD